VCALDDDALADVIVASGAREIAIVGTLRTENLGIERLISNVVANPNVRFLILAGVDARQAIGHLPGQSLAALAANGLDERGRIIGAPGKRPLIKNITPALVEHFRRTVEVIDLIGHTDADDLLRAATACAERDPGPGEPAGFVPPIAVTAGRLPEQTTPDPAGYFVVYAEPHLSLEHYRNDGVLDRIVEGQTTAEIYMSAIEAGLVSRLDHAAYLGRELTRAETARDRGERYVQDGAPEAQASIACGCVEGSCEG
jgi:tetrahydromethanopterin S-methyltransferase subunit A